MISLSTSDDDDKQRQYAKGETADSDVPRLVNRIDTEDQNRDSDSDSDSNSDDENKQRNRVEPKDVPMITPMKYNYGFFPGTNGIFDKNDNDNRRSKKTKKTGRILSDRIDDIFNDDESREINHNVSNSNMNSTRHQKSVTKNKRKSNTKNRSSYKNKDIKYKNNKKKSKKKEKSIVQKKRENNIENSSEEDNDSAPGLQDRNRPDSDSEVDKNNRSDIGDYLDSENDDQYYKLPYDLSMNSTITSE